MRMLRRLAASDILVLTGIVALAFGLRAWQIDVIPPGLHYDEAFHALEARRMVATGAVPLWLEGNFGVPPLFAFLVSIGFRLLGESPLAERSVSVVVGTLTVLTTYGMTREVLGSRRLALLAALLMAVSFQSVVFSREGLEPHLAPLFLTISIWLLWRGWRTGSWVAFAAAGVELGLGAYTYQAFWLAPLIVGPLALWLLAADPATRSLRWKQTALAAVLALAIVAPLAPHVAAQAAPGNRLAQIAGSGGQAGQSGVADNLGAVAAMFLVRGDVDPRNNLPGRPMLDPFQAVGFAAGLVVCLKGWRRPETGLWVVWLAAMSLPVALSEYAPHFRRAIGLLPALAVVTSLGFRGIWRAFAGSRLPTWLQTQAPAMVLSAGLLASTVACVRDYFVLLGPTNEFYYAFDTGLADMARYANSLPASDRAYYLPADNRHLTLQFLATRPAPPSFESRRVWVLPPTDGRATVYIAVTMEDPAALPYLRQAFPAGSVVYEGKDREGGVYFTAYRVPAGTAASVRPATVVTATLGAGMQISGYGVDTATPGRLVVTLTWRCLQTLDRDYTAFVQLVGPQGLVAGQDAQPGGGSYPTTRWQQGETVVDRFVLDVSAVKPGNYRLVTGMYLLSTMQRLSARDGAGASVPDDAVVLGSISF